MPSVPEPILEWRKRTGADRYDEMWEGVLHMPPAPTGDHNDFQWSLQTYLKLRWAKKRQARVATMNLASPGGWPSNYRIPDLILWTADRAAGNKNTHFEGPPSMAIEIRSPGDEPYEKLPFYAQLGVPEVWIIDRDSKQPEVHRLREGQYEIQAANADGWILSPETGIALRATDRGKLAIQIAGDQSSLAHLPED